MICRGNIKLWQSLLIEKKLQFISRMRYRILENPKDTSKLIFQEDGKCKIFQHKNGEPRLRWLCRVGSFFTVINCFLTGMQMSQPIFGAWNHFSFEMSAFCGFILLFSLQIMSRRMVHRMRLLKNLESVQIEFFNAFWKPKKVVYHISEFQEPTHSFAGSVRFEITSVGKVWIKLDCNEFENVKDYEETLDSILMGKPLTNLNISKRKKY